jgi:hypothetical protein
LQWAAIEWDWTHQVIGVAILVAMGVQGVLGTASHFLYDKRRTDTPWLDYLHHIFGR